MILNNLSVIIYLLIFHYYKYCKIVCIKLKIKRVIMFKKIYIALFSGVVLFAAPSKTTINNSSNIKKIIKVKNKIIVIMRENGKDKRVELDAKTLDMISKNSKKSSKTKASKKSNKKHNRKNKNSTKLAKNSKSKSASKNRSHKYTVKSGDTLFAIAKKYKVAISDLTKINKLSSNTLIKPGDILKIPSSGYTEAAKKAVEYNNKTVYKVKKGDTLYSIAKNYNMRVDTLKKLNNLKKNPKLKKGMELTVLGKPKIIEKRKHVTKYAVRRGDTLWSIARKYGLTISQLKLLNPKIRTRGLRRGAILKVSKAEAIKLAKSRYRRKKRLSGVLAKYQRSYSSGGSTNVVRYAKRWLGSRYVWGASRPGAFDCSGFTQYVMRHAKGRAIPRVSRRQAYYGRYISRRNLRPGDLIFFDTSHRRRGYVNHVAIYIGGNKFIHASSAKHRVVITSLNKPFYSSRFMWGRRIN